MRAIMVTTSSGYARTGSDTPYPPRRTSRARQGGSRSRDRPHRTLCPGEPRYRQIVGQILTKGHPVFDAYVGKPSPVIGVRNPVSYIDADEDLRRCECGCGAEVSHGPFVSGHDQRALHERVAKIGTVAEFLCWFDQVYQGHGEAVSSAVPELRHGQPQAFRRGGWNLDKYEWPDGLELFIDDDGRVKIGQWDSSVAVHDVFSTSRQESRGPAPTSWPCSLPTGSRRSGPDRYNKQGTSGTCGTAGELLYRPSSASTRAVRLAQRHAVAAKGSGGSGTSYPSPPATLSDNMPAASTGAPDVLRADLGRRLATRRTSPRHREHRRRDFGHARPMAYIHLERRSCS